MPNEVAKLPSKKQSKKYSFIESFFNVIIGYIAAVITQIIIFPLFGISIPLQKNLFIGSVFTIISIIRSYSIRRLFNSLD